MLRCWWTYQIINVCIFLHSLQFMCSSPDELRMCFCNCLVTVCLKGGSSLLSLSDAFCWLRLSWLTSWWQLPTLLPVGLCDVQCNKSIRPNINLFTWCWRSCGATTIWHTPAANSSRKVVIIPWQMKYIYWKWADYQTHRLITEIVLWLIGVWQWAGDFCFTPGPN